MVKIGDIELGEFPLLLAPMEDVSDPPFRALCKENGADVVYTEFISCEGLIRSAQKSVVKLDIFEKERPVGIQIFGANLDSMLKAIDIVEKSIVECCVSFGKDGWSKSIANETLNPLYGCILAHLSFCFTSMSFVIFINLFG